MFSSSSSSSSLYLFARLSVLNPRSLAVHVVHLSACLSLRISARLSVRPSFHLLIRRSVPSSVRSSIRPSIYPLIHQSTLPSSFCPRADGPYFGREGGFSEISPLNSTVTTGQNITLIFSYKNVLFFLSLNVLIFYPF